MWSEFGENAKTGKNLELLRKGQRWFAQNKNLKITSYQYVSKPSNWVSSRLLSDDSTKSCCICGMKLYNTKVDASNALSVSSKKHLIFKDVCGSEHHTCHGLNRCFSRVGWDHEQAQESEAELGILTMDDILPVDTSILDEDGKHHIEIFRDMFEVEILPIILYWRNVPITKDNVMMFVREWDYIIDDKLARSIQPAALKEVQRRLLTAMGVRR